VGRTNFFYLLGALLFLLFAIPLAHDLEITTAPLVRSFVFSVLLLVGVWSLRGGGRFFTIGMVLAVAGVVLNVLALQLHSAIFHFGSLALLIGFLLVTISFTLRQVVFGTELNANRLVGAVCVFLLLGVIWALLYSLLELLVPSSFAGVPPIRGPVWENSWLYFSFVTLTTLGYGDITPVSATARSLAYLQAIVGQFYVAVLVAGLVSAYISDKQGS
jgi:hypothetical protein